ncbi:DUF6415 family natural product biosynthesis protein [Streptomyces sp. NPDC002755]
MAHPTDQTVALHQRYGALIDEAEYATGILSTIDVYRRLDVDLRDAIRVLADQVRREQGRLPTSTINWTVREGALIEAQTALTGDLGRGLRSAALQVSALGAAAGRLVDCVDQG